MLPDYNKMLVWRLLTGYNSAHTSSKGEITVPYLRSMLTVQIIWFRWFVDQRLYSEYVTSGIGGHPAHTRYPWSGSGELDGKTLNTMDGFDFNSSEKAQESELQRMIAIEQQKAQFQAQVRVPPASLNQDQDHVPAH